MPTFSALVRANRRLSQRGLPYFFLGHSIIFGFIALVVPLAGWLAMAKESDLKFVAGSVQRAQLPQQA
jgi:hypothetical protein